ncbi:peptidylprolyl isomerase [Gammaproteobacteria bacterium]|nr:peptidylprolyl isomerase [Gammaproteobacteria bacterium]
MDYLIRFSFIFLALCSCSFYAFSNQLDRVAVIVNDGVVLESDIQLKVREYKKNAALEGKNIPSDEVLRETIVEQLILDELQLQIADRVGIKISDEELNLTLKTLAQQNNLSLEDFISFVENQGDSYAQLREDVRKGLKIQRVQRGRIQNKISITQEEVDNFLQTEEAQNQLTPELKVQQVLIRRDSKNNVSDVHKEILLGLANGTNFKEFVTKYSEDNNDGDLGWRKITGFPELFKNPIKALKIGSISDPIQSGAGNHILFLEDKRGPTVTFEKQWNVRHILLIPNRIRPESVSEKLITEIRERIINGESFESLATEYSDDPGSKQEGGNLGWAGEGVYAEQFEIMMKKASINSVTQPFVTQFGWHILEVLGTRVEDKTEQRIEDQAFQYLYSRKFEEELESDLQELRAESFVEIKKFD